MSLNIGITGGIGAGKSFISGMLEAMGYKVYNTDLMAKKIMAESAAVREFLIGEFGEEVYSGSVLNKEYLAGKIFGNPVYLKKINAFIHPLVLNDFKEWSARQKSRICFIESAILYESGIDKHLDKIISVSADEELRIRRVMNREKCSLQKVRERINSQMSQELKDEKSDYIIYNNERESLLEQIDYILKKISTI